MTSTARTAPCQVRLDSSPSVSATPSSSSTISVSSRSRRSTTWCIRAWYSLLRSAERSASAHANTARNPQPPATSASAVGQQRRGEGQQRLTGLGQRSEPPGRRNAILASSHPVAAPTATPITVLPTSSQPTQRSPHDETPPRVARKIAA